MSTSVVSVAVVTCTSRCGGSSVIAKLNVPCAQAWLVTARVRAAATDAVLSQAVGPSRALPSNALIDASVFCLRAGVSNETTLDRLCLRGEVVGAGGRCQGKTD